MKQKICSAKPNGNVRRNIHVKVQSTHSRTIEILNLLGEDIKEYRRKASIRMFTRMQANENLNHSI